MTMYAVMMHNLLSFFPPSFIHVHLPYLSPLLLVWRPETFPLINCIAPPQRYPSFLLGIDDADMDPYLISFLVANFTAATKSSLHAQFGLAAP